MPTSLHKKAIIALCILGGFAPQIKAQRTLTVFCRPGAQEMVSAYMWDTTDEAPSFPGGESELIRFINRERKYPREAYEAGIQGRVRCSFIVDVDGSILDISINRGFHEAFNHEAVRIIRQMPRWRPGTINGVPVPTLYMLTIPFRL